MRRKKACYTIKQNQEKGGMTMMQWNCAFDDVDDLIFMDCDWNKSDR